MKQIQMKAGLVNLMLISLTQGNSDISKEETGAKIIASLKEAINKNQRPSETVNLSLDETSSIALQYAIKSLGETLIAQSIINF